MSQHSSMLVTVIIPAFNDVERLKLCLAALEKQTLATDAYEVIVVDNNSTEPLAPVVAVFAHARCLHEAQKGSYAARNHALREARGDIFVFTDSDCIPEPNWLERGVAALQRDPEIGLVGGKIKLFAQDPAHPTAAELFEIVGAFQQKSYIEEKHYGATANVFTTRPVMDQVGPFDGRLQSGGDKEWGKRVYAAGFKQVYADDAVINHPARRTMEELRVKARRLADGRYTTRKNKSGNSLPRTLLDTVISFVPPKRTINLYFSHDLHGMQKFQVISVVMYMRYFYAYENVRHLWNELRKRS